LRRDAQLLAIAQRGMYPAAMARASHVSINKYVIVVFLRLPNMSRDLALLDAVKIAYPAGLCMAVFLELMRVIHVERDHHKRSKRKLFQWSINKLTPKNLHDFSTRSKQKAR
jgi:hypothetical protein